MLTHIGVQRYDKNNQIELLHPKSIQTSRLGMLKKINLIFTTYFPVCYLCLKIKPILP